MPQHTARRLNEQHHAMAPTKISCATCNVEFPSRNKLFQHLKDSGHGVLGLSNSSDGNTSGSGISANIGKNDLSGRNDTTNSKGNSAFYEYYLRQKICRAADDNGDNEATWKEAYQRLCTPLPMSYRIQESSWIGSDFCVDLLRSIEKQSFGCNADEDRAKIYNWSLLASRNSPNQQNGNVSPKIRMTIIPHNHNHNDSSPYLSNVVRCNEGGQNIYSSMIHALQELGAINRQELVSAIPPLVLWSANPSIDKSQRKRTDCGGKLIVADMCAAPGSKSLQLLDMLHMNSEAGETASRGVNKIHHNIPSGLLVVNDSDRNRILTLCQRLRRVPKAPMLAINVDARYFPGIRRKCKWSSRRVCNDDFKPDEDRSGDINGFSVEVEKETDKYSSTDTVEGAKTFSKEKMGYKQKYDKVLCDVPCSGDGTTRKNKQIWTSWSISHAMSLHRLQRKILRRGLELLKPGGIIVYSTCSLNPLENEAVVASVIDGIDGGVDAVEIIPLPDFVIEKCHVFNGLDSWMVPSSKFGKVKSSNKKDGKSITCQRKMYQKFDDVPKEEKSCEKGKGGTINPSMFPPASPEIRKQLRNCGRFLPGKDFDSGGFFLACMRRRKTGELNAKQQPNDIEVGVPSKVTLEKEDKHGIEGNIQSGEYLAGRSDFDVPINTSEKCVREGDWICPKCDEMNFGRRGESRCFKCKSRNVAIAKSLESTRQNQTQPLLVRPTETHSLLQSFLDFFGISSKAENPFPIDNIRIMHRSNHLTLVLASDSLSNLAISSKWAPARELGVSLASFPCTVDSEKVESISSLGNIQILDEGVPILAEHATRRHLRLDPDTFRKALAQSAIAPVATTSAAEIKRIKVTLEKCLDIGSLAGSCNWYTSLNSDSLIESWNECKANPGHFLVSCECSMESDCLDKVSIGCFSICGRIEVDGKVTIETSLRLIAAMLVAVHFYIEQVGSSPHVFNAEPVKKRRKI